MSPFTFIITAYAYIIKGKESQQLSEECHLFLNYTVALHLQIIRFRVYSFVYFTYLLPGYQFVSLQAPTSYAASSLAIKGGISNISKWQSALK